LTVKKLKLNRDLLHNKKDDVIDIKCDKEGTPLEKFWRQRVNDAKRDNCVEFVSGKQKEEKVKEEEEVIEEVKEEPTEEVSSPAPKSKKKSGGSK